MAIQREYSDTGSKDWVKKQKVVAACLTSTAWQCKELLSEHKSSVSTAVQFGSESQTELLQIE